MVASLGPTDIDVRNMQPHLKVTEMCKVFQHSYKILQWSCLGDIKLGIYWEVVSSIDSHQYGLGLHIITQYSGHVENRSGPTLGVGSTYVWQAEWVKINKQCLLVDKKKFCNRLHIFAGDNGCLSLLYT